MKLNVRERILMISLLPREANFATLRIIRDAERDLSFSEYELSVYNLQSDPSGKTTWDIEKEKETGDKEISIGDVLFSIIKSSLQKLDEANSLTIDYYSLCEKFLSEDIKQG